MKKQKAIKLQLINYLSCPDIDLLEWSIENEIIDTHTELNCYPWDWTQKELTGKKFLKLTLVKNDSSTTKE